MNGCHSTVAPMNRKHEMVALPKYKGLAWPYRFTRDCQYDKKHEDLKCVGCNETKGERND